MPITFAADAIDPPSNSMASAFLMHALNHSSPHGATMLPADGGMLMLRNGVVVSVTERR